MIWQVNRNSMIGIDLLLCHGLYWRRVLRDGYSVSVSQSFRWTFSLCPSASFNAPSRNVRI